MMILLAKKYRLIFIQFLNGSYISGKPEAYKRQCFPGFAGLHVELHVPVFWIKVFVIKKLKNWYKSFRIKNYNNNKYKIMYNKKKRFDLNK